MIETIWLMMTHHATFILFMTMAVIFMGVLATLSYLCYEFYKLIKIQHQTQHIQQQLLDTMVHSHRKTKQLLAVSFDDNNRQNYILDQLKKIDESLLEVEEKLAYVVGFVKNNNQEEPIDYQKIAKSVNQGGDIDDIVDEYHLSQDEADILTALHQPEPHFLEDSITHDEGR